jgi:hypothetical protein
MFRELIATCQVKATALGGLAVDASNHFPKATFSSKEMI